MADSRIRGLTGRSALVGGDKFIVDPAEGGDSEFITATRVQTFVVQSVNAALAAHIADDEAHGISTFMATLLGLENLAALLTALGIEFPEPGTLQIGDRLVQWGTKAIGTGGSVVSGTITLPTAFDSGTFYIVGSATNAGNSGRNQLAVTCKAASSTTATYEADTGDSSYAINQAANINWIAAGTAP